MKRKMPIEEESGSESDKDINDSDDELQQAFASGDLKPGLSVETSAPRNYANNPTLMKEKLAEITLKLDWIERLDVTTNLESIAENILEGKEKNEPQYKVETPGDKIVDDLLRETLFYRQAQAAMTVGLARIKSLGIPTRRPEDYFAQMAKSDQHMLKVKQRVLSQTVAQEKSQKVKKLRELKKYGKKVQIEVGLQRAKEKRELLSKVKQFREGKLASLDFLEENQGKKRNVLEVTKQKSKEHNESKRFGASKAKRVSKDKKFGFGGRKSGSKRNNEKKDNKERSKATKGARPGPKNKTQGGNKPKGGGKKR